MPDNYQSTSRDNASVALTLLSIGISFGVLLLVLWFALEMRSAVGELTKAIDANKAEVTKALGGAGGGISGVSTYTDPELKIAFEYPASWGEMKPDYAREVTGDAEPRRPISALLLNVLNNATVLAATTPVLPVGSLGRGGSWIDGGRAVNTPAAVEAFCTMASGSKRPSCDVFSNANGVRVARNRLPVPEWDPAVSVMTLYYIHNPKSSAYPGMVISGNGLFSNTGLPASAIESGMEALVHSIRFVD